MRTARLERLARLALDLPLGLPLPGRWRPASVAHAETGGLLVLSVSAGAGHVRAAQAICAQAHAIGVRAHHVDVMDHVPAGVRKLYTDLYLALVERYPLLWSWLYRRSHAANPHGWAERLRRASERWSTQRLRDEILRRQPQAIVCTHFLPAELLAHLKRTGRIGCPVWVQVTDFDLHRMWVHPGIDGYFAGNEEVAFRLRSQGIAAHTIHVTGIAVMPGFAEAPPRAACAREIGLDPERTTLLLMGGGAGIGGLEQIAARLLAMGGDFQLIALAGRNAAALAALQMLAERHPGRLVAHGYTDRIERLMACSDLAITKPGGLTTSECLAMGLPMILNQPIPGQEERNADYLLEQGVALKAGDAVTLEYRVRELLGQPAQLAAMRLRARRLARADAARKVVEAILGSHR